MWREFRHGLLETPTLWILDFNGRFPETVQKWQFMAPLFRARLLVIRGFS
jgi:hypothetical protein